MDGPRTGNEIKHDWGINDVGKVNNGCITICKLWYTNDKGF
jgi:hypothetical protein